MWTIFPLERTSPSCWNRPFRTAEASPALAAAGEKPVHVAGYIEELTHRAIGADRQAAVSAIRHLFDWLVVGPGYAG
jgi:hypothetical protein